MLHINDLTYRIQGKTIFEGASAGLPAGHKVGLVGRNGAGKTTLLRLISGEITPDDGSINWPKTARLGYVAQEAPGGPESLIDWVLAADTERDALLAEAETATDPLRISDIQIRLVDIDAHSAPARAAQILSGLGFNEAAQLRPCGSFSGGWRMRLALASVLFLEPDILLLDEPTNYLDLEGTIWLETYLRAYPHTVIIVSHDRDLLNKAVTSILHLDGGRLQIYTGGYDDFEEQRRETQRLQLKLKAKQDEERRHIQGFVDRFRATASKAKQAQSRIKALARMQPIAASVDAQVVPFQLPNPAKPLASPLIRLEEGAVGYSANAPILSKLDLRIDQDDRIALLGANGNGKSTFAKLISGKLRTQSGEFLASKKLTIGYFAQHQLDELNPKKSPYDHIAELMPTSTEAQKRAKLGSYGFGFDKADQKCEKLSGGEKARLMLAITAFHAPHLLILDEPTNHLDVDSRQALIQALAMYDGAVILISHDRHLVEATADRLWLVADGTVSTFDGDMDEYRDYLLAERRLGDRKPRGGGPKVKSNGGGGSASTNGSSEGKADKRKRAAEKRAELAPLRKAQTAAEKDVARLETVIAKLDQNLANPDLYANDPAKAENISIERGQAQQRLAAAEQVWLEASDRYEAAKSAAE